MADALRADVAGRAEQRTRFFDDYRSYVINYNLGKDLVKQFIESRGHRATPATVAGVRRPAGIAEAAMGVFASKKSRSMRRSQFNTKTLSNGARHGGSTLRRAASARRSRASANNARAHENTSPKMRRLVFS